MRFLLQRRPMGEHGKWCNVVAFRPADEPRITAAVGLLAAVGGCCWRVVAADDAAQRPVARWEGGRWTWLGPGWSTARPFRRVPKFSMMPTRTI